MQSEHGFPSPLQVLEAETRRLARLWCIAADWSTVFQALLKITTIRGGISLFLRLLGQQELQGVTEMLTVYEERGILKGKRDALLMQLRIKFGDLPEAVVARVQTLDTEAVLDVLLERVLRAATLEDMGLEPGPDTA
jgi:hypothetical protein